MKRLLIPLGLVVAALILNRVYAYLLLTVLPRVAPHRFSETGSTTPVLPPVSAEVPAIPSEV